MDNLQDLGKIIQNYEGRGTVTIGPQVHLQNIPFILVQFIDGRIYMDCDIYTATRDHKDMFEGLHRHYSVTTDEEREEAVRFGKVGTFEALASTGERLSVAYLILTGLYTNITFSADPPADHHSFHLRFFCKDATFATASPESPNHVRFALVNLEYDPSEGFTGYESAWQRSLPQGPPRLGDRVVTITPVGDYWNIIRNLVATKGVDITCEATIPVHEVAELPALETVMDDLCLLLTLARGTRVDWLNYEVVSASGAVLRTRCYNHERATRFGADALIDPHNTVHTKQFLEVAYPRLAAMREMWDIEHAINLYTDAQADQDIRASRGLKLAITMEVLRARFLAPRQNGGRLLNERFALVADTIKAHVQEAVAELMKELGTTPQTEASDGLTWETVSTYMTDNVPNLDFYSFKKALRAMYMSVGLDPTADATKKQLTKFVDLRNGLVHTGAFSGSAKYGSPAEQFKFLSEFVGEFLLEILRPRSERIEWEQQGQNHTLSPAEES